MEPILILEEKKDKILFYLFTFMIIGSVLIGCSFVLRHLVNETSTLTEEYSVVAQFLFIFVYKAVALASLIAIFHALILIYKLLNRNKIIVYKDFILENNTNKIPKVNITDIKYRDFVKSENKFLQKIRPLVAAIVKPSVYFPTLTHTASKNSQEIVKSSTIQIKTSGNKTYSLRLDPLLTNYNNVDIVKILRGWLDGTL